MQGRPTQPMQETCSKEILARPHMDAAFRPFSSQLNSRLSPAARTPQRRRGLSAVLAARKAAATAPSTEADTASLQRKGTLPIGRRKVLKEVPSWMAWDRDALKEQEEALARFQQSRSAIAKPEGAVRVRARSGGKSFTSDFKRAVNNDNFKEAIADTGNEVDYAYYCNGDTQWFGVYVADPDIKRAGFVTKWLGFAAQSLGPVHRRDSSIVDREIETWLPKKIVKAYSLRSKKMGTRTIAFQNGQVVFFKGIMDNALGKYLSAGLPDTSAKYNDRVARNEGKITGFLNEVQGQTAYQSFAQKTIKNREVIPKPLDPQVLQDVEQTKEEWDREKVYLAELGYVPDEADPEAWPQEDSNTKDEEVALSGKTRGRRRPKEELSDEVRDFAERAFQAAKKEAAALDAGGWNVGSVITDMKDRNRFAVVRSPRGRGIDRGRRGGAAGRQSGRQEGGEDRAYREPRAERAGWATSPASNWATSETAQWSEEATRGGQDDLLWDEPEQRSQPSPVHSQPLEDDLLDAWASLTNEPDEIVNGAPEPDLVDKKEDNRLRASSEQPSLKTPPAPKQRAGYAGADAWASRRGDAAQRGTARRSAARPLQRDAGAPRRSGWTTSGDEYSGWAEGNDVPPAGPQGWATSDDWVDDSAAAAGRFFEAGKKPARPGSQGWATAGWSESNPIVADEDVDSWSELAESTAKGQDRKFSRGGFSEDLSSLTGLKDQSSGGVNNDLDQSSAGDRPGAAAGRSQGFQEPATPARQRLPEWSRYEGSAGEVVRGEDAGRRRRRAQQSADKGLVQAPEELPQKDSVVESKAPQWSSGLVDDATPEMGNWDEWEAFMASDQATKELDPEDAADAEELFTTSEAASAEKGVAAVESAGQKKSSRSRSKSKPSIARES